MNLPTVVSREEWLAARKDLLAKEKAATRAQDALNTERRRLPMVRIEQDYVFEAPDGKRTLLDLFDGRRQLIAYHFMFDPSWDEGCPSCSLVVDNIGHLSHLHARNTSLAVLSRAPLAKIEVYRERMGWPVPWILARQRLQLRLSHHHRPCGRAARVQLRTAGRHGGRGGHAYLDLTPLGRQEDWEQPAGRSDGPIMSWLRRHDEYDARPRDDRVS